MITRLACGLATALLALSPALAFDEADALFGKVAAVCGKVFAGKVVADTPASGEPWTGIVVGSSCARSTNKVCLGLNVGEDRSRVWCFSKGKDGLTLKHWHTHEDGTPDAVTGYGGTAAAKGTATRQEFPADEESKAMFRANGLDVSVDNVWAVEVTDAVFAYELRRKGRFFRVEFDLTKPVEPTGTSWGR